MIDIYVINLQHRKDRRDKILELYKNNFNIIIVEAIKHENGRIGCFMSHQKCIKLAKEKNLKNIIIMEDDCVPFDSIEDFTKRLSNIKCYLDSCNDWSIFLGGTFGINGQNIKGKKNTDCDNLYLTNYGFCTHLMIYESNTYDYFINYSPEIMPIDRVWHGTYNAIIPVPFIATQDNSYSDVTQTQYCYNKLIRKTNKILCIYSLKN